MKKILVIDGNSIINRAFFGVRPLTTKNGKHTNAIFGMVNIISKQLDSIKPDYCAVAFDVKHPTFRHEMFTEYKAVMPTASSSSRMVRGSAVISFLMFSFSVTG